MRQEDHVKQADAVKQPSDESEKNSRIMALKGQLQLQALKVIGSRHPEICIRFKSYCERGLQLYDMALLYGCMDVAAKLHQLLGEGKDSLERLRQSGCAVPSSSYSEPLTRWMDQYNFSLEFMFKSIEAGALSFDEVVTHYFKENPNLNRSSIEGLYLLKKYLCAEEIERCLQQQLNLFDIAVLHHCQDVARKLLSDGMQHGCLDRLKQAGYVDSEIKLPVVETAPVLGETTVLRMEVDGDLQEEVLEEPKIPVVLEDFRDFNGQLFGLEKIPGLGNCLFEACWRGIKHLKQADPGHPIHAFEGHQQLRERVADFIETHWEKEGFVAVGIRPLFEEVLRAPLFEEIIRSYPDFIRLHLMYLGYQLRIAYYTQDSASLSAAKRDIERFLSNDINLVHVYTHMLRMNGCWGDNLELAVISKLFSVSIQEHGVQSVKGNYKPKYRPFTIGDHSDRIDITYSGDHFDVLLCPERARAAGFLLRSEMQQNLKQARERNFMEGPSAEFSKDGESRRMDFKWGLQASKSKCLEGGSSKCLSRRWDQGWYVSEVNALKSKQTSSQEKPILDENFRAPSLNEQGSEPIKNPLSSADLRVLLEKVVRDGCSLGILPESLIARVSCILTDYNDALIDKGEEIAEKNLEEALSRLIEAHSNESAASLRVDGNLSRQGISASLSDGNSLGQDEEPPREEGNASLRLL